MKKFILEMPTEKDWDDWTDDRPRDCVTAWNRGYAKEAFFGKTIEQVIPMLKKNFIYFDEYCDMPCACFQYYIFAITDILRNCSEAEAKDEFSEINSIASAFISIVNSRAEYDPTSLEPIMALLWPDLEYVARNQERFDLDLDIFGDLREELAEIRSLCVEKGIELTEA